MWNKWLPFRKGALRGTSTSVISTCSCWCCLTRFPSLPALKIFSPKLIFRDRLLKSSFRDVGDLGAVLPGKGRAKREGLDILTLQEFTCSKKQILKILPPAQRLGSRRVQLQLGLKRRAASSISFKQQARTGWSHSPHLPDLWNVNACEGRAGEAAPARALGSRCSSRGCQGCGVQGRGAAGDAPPTQVHRETPPRHGGTSAPRDPPAFLPQLPLLPTNASLCQQLASS